MAEETEFFERIFALTRDFERNFREPGAGVSTTQFQALSILTQGEPITAMKMAERLRIAGPTATRALDSLEHRQLIVKERDPQDRRIVWLRLTESGQVIFRQERERQTEWVQSLMQRLTAEERQVFLRLMIKLTREADFNV